MAEEKDEFEKLKKRIKEDTWEDYEGNRSHIDYDTIIEIIEEFKPKLKAQILKETLTKIKIEGSWRGFMREYVKAGGKLSEKDKEIYGDLEQEAKV